jgi:methyltransferase (TIGR00027 family)
VTSTYEQWDIVSSVGLTALGVAAARAVETGRSDALVRDPWAHRFVRRAQPPVPMPTGPDELPAGDRWRSMADFMGIRSRFFDEFFAAATDQGVHQVVLLAAGLDVRAYRLNWPPQCRLFEVDQPKVLEFKNAVLKEFGAEAACERRVVATDLREDWAGALRAAGFDPAKPTAWLAEGLLPYLPAAAEADLFAQIDRLSAPGSRIAVEHVRDMAAVFSHPMFDDDSTRQFGVDVRDLWNREPREPADERLRAHGWTVTSETMIETAHRFAREVDADTAAFVGEHALLLTGYR